MSSLQNYFVFCVVFFLFSVLFRYCTRTRILRKWIQAFGFFIFFRFDFYHVFVYVNLVFVRATSGMSGIMRDSKDVVRVMLKAARGLVLDICVTKIEYQILNVSNSFLMIVGAVTPWGSFYIFFF